MLLYDFLKEERAIYKHLLDHYVLKRVSEIKDLGVYIDSELNFEEYVYKIVQEGYRTLGFLFRNGVVIHDMDVFILFYDACVRSRLEYGSIVWGALTQRQVKIEEVQAKFVRKLIYKFNGFHPSFPEAISYDTLIKALEMKSL